MTTLRQILDSLPPRDRDLLFYAMSHDMCQWVELEGGKYIGVNTTGVLHLHSEESRGVWSFGTVRKEQNG